jgi:transposase InsO family protein
VKFVFIAAEKALYPVRMLCSVLEVSRSGFYAWIDRPTPPKTTADARLVLEIRAALARGRGAYGSPRIHRELRARGIRVGKRRIERLMRENGLVARQKRRFVHTTDSRHEHPIAPNLLDRHFDPKTANEAWAGDVTYIPTREG